MEKIDKILDLTPNQSKEIEYVPLEDRVGSSLQKDSKEDVKLITSEEVRENYDRARKTLINSMEVGNECLNKVSEDLKTIKKPEISNRMYECVGTLMRALDSSAKTLTTIHQNAGKLYTETVKEVNIDNRKQTVNMNSSDINKIINSMDEDDES